jgi:hypothetical protein
VKHTDTTTHHVDNDTQRERRASWSYRQDTEHHIMLPPIIDQGSHRHILFRQPSTGAYWFDIITWPGSLCIDGDMGTYVFRRTTDMFRFFRGEGINPYYWAQKLTAPQGRQDVRHYSATSFEEAVADWRDAYRDDMLAEEFDLFSSKIADKVLRYSGDEHEALTAWHDFKCPHTGIAGHDCYEYDTDEWDYQFLWCCNAIVDGIKRYDEAKANR